MPDLRLNVHKLNGDIKGRRIIEAFSGEALIDEVLIDTRVPFLRKEFISGLEAKLGVDKGALATLDTKIINMAREKDQGKDQAKCIERITCAELAAGDYSQRYHIDGILPAGQPGVIGGKFKSLKTSICIDAALSVASSKPFLGTFHVAEPCRVGIVSAESGLATLKETALRIAQAKQLELAKCDGLVWSTTLPKLPQEIDLLQKFITEDELGLLFLDPLYLMLGGAADNASNLYAMAGTFQHFTDLVQRTGCTLVVLHHARKGRAADVGRYDPPELGELSQAGVCEWARFWLLTAPAREFDEETGEHNLWLRAGGSAGHHGLHALRVVEGRRTDPGGRQWLVTLSGASDARRDAERKKEEQRVKRMELAEGEQRRRLLSIMRKHSQGETARQLKELTGLRGGAFTKAIDALLATSEIEACDIEKAGKLHAGYRPKREQCAGASVSAPSSEHGAPEEGGVRVAPSLEVPAAHSFPEANEEGTEEESF